MFEIEKLLRYSKDAEQRRFEKIASLFPFEAAYDTADADTIHHTCPVFETEFQAGQYYHFEGRDRYLCMKKEIHVPAAEDGKNIVGVFDFGVTGGGHNNGFESVLYVNGQIFQGVDSNHKEVFLDAYADQDITLTFLLWTGINEGRMEPLHHMFLQADLGYLNIASDQFYYLSRAVTETIKFLPQTDSVRYELIRIMEDTFQLIRWEKECYAASAEKALEYLRTALKEKKQEDPYTVHCIGHTHIDVAWLWRLKHTHEKALRSFASVMRNMERYEDYTFVQSQPQLYQFIKEDDPQLYEQMGKRIAEGRWITDGAMWLEADCNISSGEALARQMLYGIRYFEKEYGKKCRVLWLPDVFGYSWALPQILKESDIEYFVTTKISWNQINSMPHDLFIWKGIDGSEVTTYFINTPEEGQPEDRWYATYNGFLSPEVLLGAANRFKDKEFGRDLLISYGYGDGGGGPNREMLEMCQAMKQIPGLPNIVTGSVTECLDKAREQLMESHHKPVWDGELYLEYHRGTYTSQSFNKKMNRQTEFAMTETEFLRTLAMEKGVEYPKAEIDECWTTILRNQFHDIIPGSSINEVYVDSGKEYAKVLDTCSRLNTEAAGILIEPEEGAYTFWHMGSFVRKDQVLVPVQEENLCFYDKNGMELESQKTEEGYAVQVIAEPMTLTTISWKKKEEQKSDIVFQVDSVQRCINTPHYTITWLENGMLNRIYDKDEDREVLADGVPGNQLTVFEDRPMNYENWDIDCYYEEKKDYFRLNRPVEVVGNGGLILKLRFSYEYHNSTLIQDMILYRDSRRIDFETTVNWQEDHQLLKTVFTVDIRTQKASYDIQYGYVERPVHRNTSWDAARFESVGQKWADLSETDYGVSILNNCKYGYGIYENQMTLSLLKSTKYPDMYMDMGERSFTYSLLPHTGNAATGDTIAESIILNQPIHGVSGKVMMEDAMYIARVLGADGCAQDQVVIDAIKKSEDGEDRIIRIHECRGARARIRLDVKNAGRVEECNILENSKNNVVDLNQPIILRPFEIKTYRICR